MKDINFIRKFPKKQKFHIDDIVVSIKTKNQDEYGSGEYYENNKQYKVYDVMQCHECGEEYIHINPNHGEHHELFSRCTKCHKFIFVDNKLWSNAKNFKSILESRRIKLEQIKYNKLNLFRKLIYKLKIK